MGLVKLLILCHIILAAPLANATYATEEKLLIDLKQAGIHDMIVLPFNEVRFKIHTLDKDGKHSQIKNPREMARKDLAQREDQLSYYIRKDSPMPLVAFKVSDVMVCYRKPVTQTMLAGEVNNPNLFHTGWNHCFIFPRPVREVLTQLSEAS